MDGACIFNIGIDGAGCYDQYVYRESSKKIEHRVNFCSFARTDILYLQLGEVF